jgi:hypothetical protein
MNAYFFKITEEERQNILDKHKTVYDGYVVRQQNPSGEQPLYVQDYANDKGGVVVNNKGEVKNYTNVGINEQFRKGVDLGKYDLKKIFIDDKEDDIEDEINDLEDNEIELDDKETSMEDNEQYEKVSEVGFSDTPKKEVEELAPESLKKGKKYRYMTPSVEDKLEFDSEVEYPQGDKMYKFKGEKYGSHLLSGKGIETDVTDDYEEMSDEDVINWAMSKSKKKESDVEDISWEDITEGLNEEVKEGILDFLKSKKSEKNRKPYTAEAVQHIIKLIKNAKTEEHLDSVMNMVNNLYGMNDDVNDAYKERINIAYRRKADELGNYLGKQDINKIMSSVDEMLDEDDKEDIKESIQESLNWFNRFKKYN